MRKKNIEGVINYDGMCDTWSFETDSHSYDGMVCGAIDQLLGIETVEGEKFRITIEKI